MTVDHSKLRELALAATPGSWKFETPECLYESIWAEAGHDDELYDIPRNSADSEYIAAASPSTVLELLDECERLRSLAADIPDLLADAHTQLVAMTAARDEACLIADHLANYIANDNPYASKLERIDRIAELRKVGEP
jgi:hypothetical protein